MEVDRGKILVTTSWDDGHSLDLKVADLLKKYNLTGTFYISKKYLQNRMKSHEIKHLSENNFEIGAHTINHPNLNDISLSQAETEIKDSKRWLEDVIEKEVESFCYPKGKFNNEIRKVVKKCNFSCARTVKKYSIYSNKNDFNISTSLQVYPFPFRKRNTKIYQYKKFFQPLIKDFYDIRKIGVPFFKLGNWVNLSQGVFDLALRKGDFFHLWGHSWEIEKYGMWSELEQVFDYISNRNDCDYVTNSELVS